MRQRRSPATEVPLYGAQTQLAIENFPISGLRFPRPFLRALAMLKGAAAVVNRELGLLEPALGDAIEQASREMEDGRHDSQFPVDVYQTGSGTSTNMNANEVIAALASQRLQRAVHPNDHVNLGQSSNDVIPTTIHVSVYLAVVSDLTPALGELWRAVDETGERLRGVIKTGRTHLMDAMPLRMSQEFSAWSKQLRDVEERLQSAMPRLAELAIGGTAVGTGVNTHPEFGERVAAHLATRTGHPFCASRNCFASIASQDTAVELSGHLRSAAIAITKIANDLRWMNSGPVAGLAEISLPALQAGSSIMPGKVNPVIAEAALMVCVRVIANDAAISLAGMSGNFQLNTMLPLIAVCLLESIQLLSRASTLLAEKAIRGLEVDEGHLREQVNRSPMMATMLSPLIGYDRAAAIATRAIHEGRTIRDVAAETTELTAEELDRLLDPARAAGGRPM